MIFGEIIENRETSTDKRRNRKKTNLAVMPGKSLEKPVASQDGLPRLEPGRSSQLQLEDVAATVFVAERPGIGGGLTVGFLHSVLTNSVRASRQLRNVLCEIIPEKVGRNDTDFGAATCRMRNEYKVGWAILPENLAIRSPLPGVSA